VHEPGRIRRGFPGGGFLGDGTVERMLGPVRRPLRKKLLEGKIARKYSSAIVTNELREFLGF